MPVSGLHSALSGIRAAQFGLDTASNNIANANTPGYTRQRVDLSAAAPTQTVTAPSGMGVTIDGVTRLRDQFADSRARSTSAAAGETAAQAQFLTNLEQLAGEPDQGLSDATQQLWAAFEDWSNTPDSDAARRQAMDSIAAIASTFRTTAESWDRLGADTEKQLDTAIAEVNETLMSLHSDYNVPIANELPGMTDPTVLDQRDQRLDRLAELAGVTATINDDSTITVRINGQSLLEPGNEPAQLSLAGGGGQTTPELRIEQVDGTTTAAAASGLIGGLHQAAHHDLPHWHEQLDDLAALFIDTINAQNALGMRNDGSPGGDLLGVAGNSSAAIGIALITDRTEDLAAGRATQGPPGVFDAANARAFADLRTAELPLNSATPEPSFDAQISGFVVGLAGAVGSAQAQQETAESARTSAAMVQAGQHGVSIDEEMVDLVRFQRALEASARVLTAVDESLDVLINRTGVVGR